MSAKRHESLGAMLEGIRVNPQDLHSAADWLKTIREHWDEAVVGEVRETIEPLYRSAGSHHVGGWTNAYGRFDEADNIKRTVGDGHDALGDRVRKISGLLEDLRAVTARIAANYEATELDNAANQKALIAQLDAAMTPEASSGDRA